MTGSFDMIMPHEELVALGTARYGASLSLTFFWINTLHNDRTY